MTGTYIDEYYGVECPFENRFLLSNENGPDLGISNVAQTCTGVNDGTATVVVNNPTGDYDYSWSTGTAGATTSNLSSGRIHAYVTDQVGCTSIVETWVGNQGSVYDYSSTDGSICNGSTGGIDYTVGGGTNVGPFDILWSDGATTEDRSNLTPGVYNVTATDPSGCNISRSVTVYDDCNGRIVCEDDYVTVNNETGGYVFQFNNDTDASDAEITTVNVGSATQGWAYGNLFYFPNENTNLHYYPYDQSYTGPDQFTYTVCTDYGFCDSATVYLNIVSDPVPQVQTANGVEDLVICEGESVTLVATGAVTFDWFPTTGLSNPTGSYVEAAPDQTTTYTLTGTNSAGQTATTTVTVEVVAASSVDILSLPSTIGVDASPVTLDATVSGGTFSGTGVFFNAFNPSVAGPGMHEITYMTIDENGCALSTSESILVFNATFNFVNYSLGTITPRSGEIVIETNAEILGGYVVVLSDMLGRTLVSEQIEIQETKQRHSIHTNELKNGIYVLSLQKDNYIYSGQISINN